MSIVFILLLISALSAYIVMVNDQVAYSYDIVVQIEKDFQSFYETEFVIYYVLGFYQKNYQVLVMPCSKNFEIYCSPSRKKITISVEFSTFEHDVTLFIIIHKEDFPHVETVVNCNLALGNDGLIKLKNYYIERKNC